MNPRPTETKSCNYINRKYDANASRGSSEANLFMVSHSPTGHMYPIQGAAIDGRRIAGGVVPTVRHAPLVRNGPAEKIPPGKIKSGERLLLYPDV
jgi:hypothetical protein